MIVDTSALIAILEDEPEADELAVRVASNAAAMSAISYLEGSIVLLRRRGPAALLALDAWIESADIEIVPFDKAQARAARHAYERFGKGRHPAALNFGDCAAYALAAERDESLLFVGDDFGRTDIPDAKIR